MLTRREREKQREYWRRKQAESRNRRHPQKVRRKKEKDRVNLKAKRVQFKLRAVGKKVRKTRTKSIKIRQALLESIKGNVEARNKIAKSLIALRKLRLNKAVSTYLGINESYMSKLKKQDETQKRKMRKDKTPIGTQRKIESYFRQGDVSTNLPDAKRVKVDLQERRVLDRTLKETYKEYKQSNPEDTSVSFSTFAKMKPRNVETTTKRKWNACLCEVCTNVDLKIRSLSQLAAQCKSDVKVENKYDAVAKTLCVKEKYQKWHKKSCTKRECISCGTKKIIEYYKPLVTAAANRLIRYTKWERVTKVRNGKQVTQIMPTTHEKTANLVVEDLANELEKLSDHLFVAAWQQDQFSKLWKTVPPKWVILNMDFSENYSCVDQSEVQSAHWGHNMVTIHPTVAFYRCPEEDCEDIIQEALIFVSNDMVHDSNAVAKFVAVANEHLKQVRGLTIQKEIQMTDGCAAQYKSKTPFTDISFSMEDHGFTVERHYYGSRHGKGPSDGAGAVVKSGARRAVMGMNCIINDAEDLYRFGKEKLETTEKKDGHFHHKRSFFSSK